MVSKNEVNVRFQTKTATLSKNALWNWPNGVFVYFKMQ